MVAIGIDIGGTSIKGAAVNKEGLIIDTFSFMVNQGNSSDETISTLCKELNKFITKIKNKNKDIIGIGIGCAGAINSALGIVDYSNNLGWDNVPIKEMVEKATGFKVRITNDANAATIGEAKFGAGKEYSSLVLLTLGTGVGGGVIINHQLFEGNEGKGTELGHTVINFDGEMCTCGRRGCLEAYASATALIRNTKRAMETDPTSLMWSLVDGDLNKVDGRVAFDARRAGDTTASKVVNDYIFYLGEGILNLCNIFRPDAIILSGGIANEGKYLLDLLEEYCQTNHYGYTGAPKTKIDKAILGYNAGMIGAAALFL